MADDLVQRLRVSAGTAPHWLRNVYREAADEIERLRAENARLLAEVLPRANEIGLREKAERELAELRERIASLQSAIDKAPSVDGARMTYIEQDRVLDQLYELSREGHRVRLVRED